MKKTYISVKVGLIHDPKHRAAMGECIWLFLKILDMANWDNGIVYDWKDEAIAEEMGMPIRTLREQRRKLDQGGYITSVQKQYTQEIIIANWTNPREYSGEVKNSKKQGDSKASPSETQGYIQGYTQGSTQDVTPTYDSTINNQQSVGDFSNPPKSNPHNKDMIDYYIDMAKSPGVKKAVRLLGWESMFSKAMGKNCTGQRWQKFLDYVDRAWLNEKYDPEKFIHWMTSQKDYDPIYWSPARMQENYPLAFIKTEQSVSSEYRMINQ